MGNRTLTALGGMILALVIAGVFNYLGFLDFGVNRMSTVAPESEFARSILSLYSIIFWLAVVVFVVVEGALVFAVLRYRRRPSDRERGLPPQTHGNTVLEVLWTIAPAVILFVIAVPTIQTIFAASTEPPGERFEIVVRGHQWWWEFEYPGLGVITANEVHVPVDRNVAFRLESADVIHSFWVPRLGGKLDVVPNHVNFLYFAAEEPGEYYGQCVEFCGVQHANMKFRLFAHTQEDFDNWLRGQQQPPVVAGDLAEQGREVFMTSACVGCHTIQGTPAQGRIGPDLTHFGSRATIAAGMLDNTPENLALWLRNPQEVKPGNLMPDLRLAEEDILLLVAYLESLQ